MSYLGENDLIDVRSFGAVGDGDADDTAAIVATIAEQRSSGRGIWFPRGLYRITSSLVVDYANSVSDKFFTNMLIRGQNPSRDVVAFDGAVLLWDGNATDPMLHLKSRGITVEGLAFRVQFGKTCAAAILWDKGAANAATAYIVRRCQIFSSAGHAGQSPTGQFTNGLVIGEGATNNLEHNIIEETQFAGCTNACILVNTTTGQSKYNVIRNCNMSFSKRGVETVTGGFVTDGFVTCRDLEVAFFVGAPAHPMVMRGIDSEECDRIFEAGINSNNWPIVIEGARISLGVARVYSQVGPNFAWFAIGNPGIVHLSDVGLEYAGTIDPALWRISMVGTGAGQGGHIICDGCTFLGPNPFITAVGFPDPLYIHMTSCKYRTFSGAPFTPIGWLRLKSGIYQMPVGSTVLPAYEYLDVPNEGVAIPNTGAAPTVGLAGHIKLFVEAGVLKYIDDTNTVRTVQVLP